jgi:hypothetical protein
MKVALCFWGLCRSTHLTIASIQTHIFDALKQQGIEYDVFLHSYTLFRPYTNTRTGETECQIKNTNWKYLQPTKATIENQDEVDTHLQLIRYRSKGDPWDLPEEENHTPFQTLDNHVRALWSLHQVTMLWETSSTKYDYIVYLRPDVGYLQPICKDYFALANTASICIPDFHHFFGSNDRFAICVPKVAAVYGHRFHHAYQYSLSKMLHSEAFLTDTIRTAGLHFVTIPFRFRRIRANGRIAQADKEIRAHT